MQVSFRTIQTSVGRKPVGGALRARAAVRPALRQGSAFLLGLAGGWAVLYGALMPFGLGLTLGFAEDCFAVGAAGAALGAAGVMATNTSQRQMRRTARKIAKGAEHAVSQLDKMVGDFVEHKMEG